MLTFDPWTMLLLGLVTGLAFGFLLQRGGVTKYQVIVGQFLLAMSTRTNLLILQTEPESRKMEDRRPRTDDGIRPPPVLRPPSSVFCLLSSVLALGLVALGVAGCEQPQKQTPKPAVGEHTTSIEDLALRLGLRIEERDEAFVVLKNAANTVIIFTHADGRFFVNGKPMGPVGEIKRQGNTVHVPDFLIPQIRQYLLTTMPQPPVTRPSQPKAKALVVIDAGHGGHDPGTISAGGIYEKDINLQVAAKVAGILGQKGVGVVMTRQQDQFIELEERADIANRRNADLFVSIHSDSAPDQSIQGFTVYVSRAASPEAYRAASDISQALATTGSESHGIREADYKVLVNTSGPAVLIELGYLSNAQDCAHLRDPAYQNRLARAITNGILAYVR